MDYCAEAVRPMCIKCSTDNNDDWRLFFTALEAWDPFGALFPYVHYRKISRVILPLKHFGETHPFSVFF
jgi:hypothetical protein